MSVTISQLTSSITASTADDFLVVVDSGSLTTFKTTLSSLRSWESLSGSFLSASWATHSFIVDTASFVPTASYAKSSSVILSLEYNGSTFNGTASYALSSSVNRTGSFSRLAITSSRSQTSSFALFSTNTNNVFSTSFALFSANTNTALFSSHSSVATTASYINLSAIDIDFQKAYGPFTASATTSSRWGWTDPIEQAIPIIILKDNTDLICKVRAQIMHDEADDVNGYYVVEARMFPLTSSTAPGIYRTASNNDTLGTADDYVYSAGDNTYYPCSYGCFTHLLEFKKTGLSKGTYIIWVLNRLYAQTINATEITFEEWAHAKGVGFGGITTGRYISDNSPSNGSGEQFEKMLYPSSGSSKAIVISNKPVSPGIMFASTASMGQVGSVYNFYGNKNGNHGRIYSMPFLVNQSSISAGFCSASFSFRSGSSLLTASFSASTAGRSVNDIVVAYTVGLPAVANFWTTSTVVQGTPLASIPIRTDQSSSWIPF